MTQELTRFINVPQQNIYLYMVKLYDILAFKKYKKVTVGNLCGIRETRPPGHLHTNTSWIGVPTTARSIVFYYLFLR